MALTRALRVLLEMATAAVLYWAAGRIALLMALPPGYATAVWPSAGIALVCVLAWGWRVLPGVALGSFLVNIGTSVDAAPFVRTMAIAGAIGAGAALEAGVGAYLIRKYVGFPSELDRARQVIAFVILGGPIACVIGASVGIATLSIAGVMPAGAVGFNWATWWVGDLIGVLVFAPLALIATRRTRVWMRRRVAVALPLIVGFGVITLIFLRASTWERDRQRATFERRATPLATVLRAQLSTYEEIALGVASYFEASQDVTRDEFAMFCARPLATHVALMALSWNPIVRDEDRARFEATARLTERTAEGLSSARRREEYVPVGYIEPPARNASAVGFDTASDPARRDAITRARRTQRLAATTRVELVQIPRGQPNEGVLLFAPVVRREGAAKTTVGFAVATFRIRDLVDAALAEVDHRGMAISVHDTRDAVNALFADPPGDATSGAHRALIEVADRTWELSIVPTFAAVASERGWQAWAVLAGGLLFVGLLGVALLVASGHTSRLEALSEDVMKSEARYRALYEDSPDMYLTVHMPSEQIVDCNGTLCDRLGYTKAELVGRPFHIVYQPDFLPHASEAAAVFQQTGTFEDVERTLRTKAGSTIDVSLNLRAIRNDAGAVVGARAVWRDITRRKQLEGDQRFLLRLGDLLRSTSEIDDALDGVARVVSRHLDASRCVFLDVDVQRGQVTSLGTDRVTRPLPAMWNEVTAGQPIAIDEVPEDDGFGRASIAVPLFQDVVWNGSVVVVSDVPREWAPREIALVEAIAERVWPWVERQRALAALREAAVQAAIRNTEERFAAVVQGLREYAIFMLDRDGNVGTWNGAAARLTGYSDAEVVGKSFAVFHPEPLASTSLTDARDRGELLEEGWRQRKDGSRFWADVSITPMRSADGIDGYAIVMRDASERRQQDQVLRQSLRERDVLLQEVHHRVKNNLQVISSLISMQVRRLEKGPIRDAIGETQSRVLAIALIHEKLYQSKDYAEVPLRDYTKSLAQNVFHALGVSMTEVALTLEIEDVSLGMDRAIPCGLVINELITNALKHAFPGGKGSLRVAMSREGNQLRLIVADDGVGLPPAFDIRRARSMGLQLVGTLAKQLRAELVVRSEGGAAFQLTFDR